MTPARTSMPKHELVTGKQPSGRVRYCKIEEVYGLYHDECHARAPNQTWTHRPPIRPPSRPVYSSGHVSKQTGSLLVALHAAAQ